MSWPHPQLEDQAWPRFLHDIWSTPHGQHELETQVQGTVFNIQLFCSLFTFAVVSVLEFLMVTVVPTLHRKETSWVSGIRRGDGSEHGIGGEDAVTPRQAQLQHPLMGKIIGQPGSTDWIPTHLLAVFKYQRAGWPWHPIPFFHDRPLVSCSRRLNNHGLSRYLLSVLHVGLFSHQGIFSPTFSAWLMPTLSLEGPNSSISCLKNLSLLPPLAPLSHASCDHNGHYVCPPTQCCDFCEDRDDVFWHSQGILACPEKSEGGCLA